MTQTKSRSSHISRQKTSLDSVISTLLSTLTLKEPHILEDKEGQKRTYKKGGYLFNFLFHSLLIINFQSMY